MKQCLIETEFDGAKFAKRYGLSTFDGEFYATVDPRGRTVLNYPDRLPDPNALVIEPPDPPIVRPDAAIAAARAGSANNKQVQQVLAWMLARIDDV